MRLIFNPTYYHSLAQIYEYSVETFGKRVANEFRAEARQKTQLLRTMPNIYAKCRFVESSETKVYRTIVVRSYFIIYSVTASQVTVIDIIHASTNPENIRDRVFL
jgi:plasmid stabilization system protein ParE